MKLGKLIQKNPCIAVDGEYYHAGTYEQNKFKKHFNKKMNKVGAKTEGVIFYRSTCGKIECSVIN